jgi:predicted metal-dependent enzyme (double-stranded beta helix superfamily)
MSAPLSSSHPTEPADSVHLLQRLIEQAVRQGETGATVRTIQRDLAEAIRLGQVRLGARFCQIKTGSYARRLLFRDLKMGYSGVVMTWAPGQTTPIHDHAGIWCVEGVLQGEINVTRYKVERQTGELFLFAEQAFIRASFGSTGSLIPPDEYHVLANTTNSIAITLHVYGGEMDHCNIYTPRSDEWCERTRHTMTYDP